MNELKNELFTCVKIFSISALVFCSFSLWKIIIYLIKEIKWESNLKRYRIIRDNVINPQGHIITTPEELLKELQGIEERIAK